MMQPLSFKKRILAGLVIGLLAASFLVALTFSLPLEQDPPGVYPENTIFADLIGSPFPFTYDVAELVLNDESFIVNLTQWNHSMITSEEAVVSAEAFLEHNIESALLEQLNMTSNVLLEGIPEWRAKFQGTSFDAVVRVNAFSGKPIGWTLRDIDIQKLGLQDGIWLGHDSAERIAYDFLEHNNYSVPAEARYMGTQDWYLVGSQDTADLTANPHYYTVFEQTINGVPIRSFPMLYHVPDHGIVLRIDRNIGMVTEFQYLWLEFEDMAMQWTISKVTAEQIALENTEEQDCGNCTIVSQDLLVSKIGVYGSSTLSPHFRLVWVVSVRVPLRAGLFSPAELAIDARTGEFIEARHYRYTLGPPSLQIPPTLASLLLLEGVVGFVSVGAALIVAHNLKNRPIVQLDEEFDSHVE